MLTRIKKIKQLTVLSSIISTNSGYAKVSIHQIGYFKFISAYAIRPVHVLLSKVDLDYLLILSIKKLEQNPDKIWIKLMLSRF